MRVRPVDPREVTSEELTVMHVIRTAVLAADEPDRRRPTRTELAAELTAPWPGTRTAYWLSRDETDDTPVGLARLVMPGGVNQHVAHTEIDVLPAYRRSGAGRQLMREAIRMAYSCGREFVLARVPDVGPGSGFVRTTHAEPVHHEVRCVLDLAGVDPGSAAGGLAPTGYTMTRLRGGTPAPLRDQVAAVHQGMGDAPQGDSSLQPEPHDAARVAAFDAMLSTRGLTQLRVLACEQATGQPVGITYVLVPRRSPEQAEQGDTVVLAAHRGAGLGRALKLEMQRWLRADFPGVRELTTWVAADNAPIRALNRSLGYRQAAAYTHWQVPTDDVTAHLGMR